jgi:hypothetical protein
MVTDSQYVNKPVKSVNVHRIMLKITLYKQIGSIYMVLHSQDMVTGT